MNSTTNQSLSYRDAGVDIDAGDALVEAIKPFAKRTMREGVLGGIGGFGALFEISKKYKEPVLVSGTDGVGTKLKLAFHLNRHDTVGIDLVAMSANAFVEDIKRSRRAGMNEHIAKPIDMKLLVNIIAQLVH